jgi:hypothetical protein
MSQFNSKDYTDIGWLNGSKIVSDRIDDCIRHNHKFTRVDKGQDKNYERIEACKTCKILWHTDIGG